MAVHHRALDPRVVGVGVVDLVPAVHTHRRLLVGRLWVEELVDPRAEPREQGEMCGGIVPAVVALFDQTLKETLRRL